MIWEVVKWILAVLGASTALYGASLFWVQQATISGSDIWPLPALVLIDWALLGLAVFWGVSLGVKRTPDLAMKTAWLASGALLTMAILGGFSIGYQVLLTLIPLLGAVLIAAWQTNFRLLSGLGWFGIGAVGYLLFMLLLIALSNPSF